MRVRVLQESQHSCRMLKKRASTQEPCSKCPRIQGGIIFGVDHFCRDIFCRGGRDCEILLAVFILILGGRDGFERRGFSELYICLFLGVIYVARLYCRHSRGCSSALEPMLDYRVASIPEGEYEDEDCPEAMPRGPRFDI
jgi:hypothetical protein